MRLETLEVVPALLVTGVWWDIEESVTCDPRTQPHATHGCVLVVPYGDDYDRVVAELRTAYAVEIRANAGRAPENIASEIRGQALGRSVLKGWSNLELDGKPLDYSAERAVELMSATKWKHLRDRVEAAASTERAVRVQEEQRAAGN